MCGEGEGAVERHVAWVVWGHGVKRAKFVAGCCHCGGQAGPGGLVVWECLGLQSGNNRQMNLTPALPASRVAGTGGNTLPGCKMSREVPVRGLSPVWGVKGSSALEDPLPGGDLGPVPDGCWRCGSWRGSELSTAPNFPLSSACSPQSSFPLNHLNWFCSAVGKPCSEYNG